MDLLNRIVAYWHDCIKNEDILGKDISLQVKRKAVLYPFGSDPFVFETKDEPVPISGDERLLHFSEYVSIQEYESFYGYPVLFYYDDESQKFLLAPLFIIKVKFVGKIEGLCLEKDERFPTCGIQALSRLGLRTEEIADISQSIEKLFRSGRFNRRRLAEEALATIEKEAVLQVNESIDPDKLTNSEPLSKNAPPGLYNKSLIFAGENTSYNTSLLQDLLELTKRNDLCNTALGFILRQAPLTKGTEQTPILPFPANEYQVKALQHIFDSPLSVITGPPGTGKSQFISNLIINLFLQGKSVLFVSHTNEAVDVVNRKIGEQFGNLMFRTGNKEFRQELKGKFNEMILQSARKPSKDLQMGHLQSMWKMILKYREQLLEQDRLEEQFENNYRIYRARRDLFSGDRNLERSFRELSPELPKLKIHITELERLKAKIEGNKFSLWEKIVLFIFPGWAKRRKESLFAALTHILPVDALRILQNSPQAIPIRDWADHAWLRLQEYLELLGLFFELEALRKKLEALDPKVVLEQRIRKVERDFYDASREFVGNVYLQKMLGNDEAIGKVKSFLHQVDSKRGNEDGIEGHSFQTVLKVLRVWSCTLKSIRRTFPLSPAIFDYVIFDEASQVDLPSAAPALYRAKRVIVVGDPMQLSHIASLTREIDEGLAKAHELTEHKEIYPSKIRYRDITLYKCAEHSLNRKPILLVNHYRSEDEIIALCNQTFYEGRLRIMTVLDHSRFPNDLPLGVHWIDCKGEVFKHHAGSRVNLAEVQKVNEIFQDVLQKISGTNLSVGIVTPYSRQQEAINQKIAETTSLELLERHNVRVLTAHKFQGSEKDIMIFSLVLAARGNGNSDRWYNIYPQILNVALSRARYLLYIVGDKKFCHAREGVLRRLAETYDDIKKQEKKEEYALQGKFDSPTEAYLFSKLQDVDFECLGYRLIPKVVVKRYTLDFALVGKKKIDIECDGCQHESIEGLPVIEDVERDEYLRKQGWQVVRFPNHKILSEVDAVVHAILDLLK